MKRYETPQATEVGEAETVVLGLKDKAVDDEYGGIPTNRHDSTSVVDTDE